MPASTILPGIKAKKIGGWGMKPKPLFAPVDFRICI
jgi:hypothetical protein